MASNSRYKVINFDGEAILYDTGFVSTPTLSLFDREAQDHNQQKESGIGRARVVYFTHNNVSMVLKHYYRGGAVSRVISDRYFGLNVENSRAFKEWHLLKIMRDFGLPVPDAVAAHVKKGRLSYQADLITRKIEDSQTLADVLSAGCIGDAQWHKVGACIKAFHLKEVYHADLNARNILVDQNDEIYLIDFDNSYIRRNVLTWGQSNLDRLKRSLLKFKKNEPVFNFDEKNWSSLMDGYKGMV